MLQNLSSADGQKWVAIKDMLKWVGCHTRVMEQSLFLSMMEQSLFIVLFLVPFYNWQLPALLTGLGGV